MYVKVDKNKCLGVRITEPIELVKMFLNGRPGCGEDSQVLTLSFFTKQ